MSLRAKYGEYLTGKRIEAGLTLKQLSEKADIPERKLLAIETEKVQNFSIHDIRMFCKVLNVSLDEVFND